MKNLNPYRTGNETGIKKPSTRLTELMGLVAGVTSWIGYAYLVLIAIQSLHEVEPPSATWAVKLGIFVSGVAAACLMIRAYGARNGVSLFVFVVIIPALLVAAGALKGVIKF